MFLTFFSVNLSGIISYTQYGLCNIHVTLSHFFSLSKISLQPELIYIVIKNEVGVMLNMLNLRVG